MGTQREWEAPEGNWDEHQLSSNYTWFCNLLMLLSWVTHCIHWIWGFCHAHFFSIQSHSKGFELKGRGWGTLDSSPSRKPWILYANFLITFNLYISMLSISYMSNIYVSTSSEILLLNLGMRKDPEWHPGFLLHILGFRVQTSLGMSLSSLWHFLWFMKPAGQGIDIWEILLGFLKSMKKL